MKKLITLLLCASIHLVANAQLNVLVCGSESAANAAWLTDVQNKLISTGQFASVGTFNTSFGTPTVAQLQSYGAVLAYTDNAILDPNTLGNNLATYINGGGGVVSMTFDNATIPILGAFNSSNYRVLNPTGGQTVGANGLGAVLLPSHPIMTGVTSFHGGTSSFRSTSSSLAGSSYRVANWGDGLPLITARENVGPALAKRADINFYPVSNTMRSDFWMSGTSGAIIMANALSWVAPPPLTVISGFSPASGCIGSTVTITGLNFVGVTAVKFGLTNAAFTVISSTTIVATVPSAGSSIITVTSSTNTASSPTPFFVIFPR